MDLKINKEFEKLLDSLTVEEFELLENSILQEGIKEPLQIWGDIIVDGHNRYFIAKKHGLKFEVKQLYFTDIFEAKEWIIKNQFGRRNLTELQKSYLRGLRYENEKLKSGIRTDLSQKLGKVTTYKKIAEEYNVSKNTILNDANFSKGVDIISQIAPEKKTEILQQKSELTKQQVQSFGKIEKQAEKETKKNSILISENDLQTKIKERAEILAKEKLKQIENEKIAKIEAKKEKLLIKKANEIKAIETKIENITFDFIKNCNTLEIEYPDNIKVLFTDPPYGQNFISNRRVISEKDNGIKNDNNIEESLLLLDSVLKKAYDKMLPDSFAFVFTSWRFEPEFRIVFEKYFKLKNSIIWVKNNHGSGDLNGSFAPKHERILFGIKGKPKLNYRIPDVLEGSEIITKHPTSKPIDLIIKLLNTTTKENDLILEPFAGHGSTVIAALKLKLKVFATEIDKENYNNILNNLKC